RHRFLHDSLRVVAARDLPPERRRALHRACGEALEAQPPEAERRLAELAYHFKQAGERKKAVDYFEAAARQALSKFANGEAARLFQELLQLVPENAAEPERLRRAQWERGLGDALHGLGQLDASRAHLETSLRLLGQALPVGQARLSMSLLGQLARQV